MSRLDSSYLGLPYSGNTRKVQLVKNFLKESDEIKFEYGCKSYMFGLYFFMVQRHDRICYIMPYWGDAKLVAHMKGSNIAKAADCYVDGLDVEMSRRYPTLASLLNAPDKNTARPHYFNGDVILVTKMHAPKSSPAMSSLYRESVPKFLSVLEIAEKEAEKLLGESGYPFRTIEVLKKDYNNFLHDLPDLHLPHNAVGAKYVYSYARYLASESLETYRYVIQTVVNGQRLTFALCRNNMFSGKAIFKCNIGGEFGRVSDNVPDALPESLQLFFPAIYDFTKRVNTHRPHYIGFSMVEMDLKCDFPQNFYSRPDRFIWEMADRFIDCLSLAAVDAHRFRMSKAYKQMIAVKKKEDKKAERRGVYMLAKLGAALIVGANILPDGADQIDGFDGVDMGNVSAGDIDYKALSELIEAPEEANVSDVVGGADAVGGSDGVNAVDSDTFTGNQAIRSKPGMLYSNPYDTGLDFEMAHSLGMIDDNGYKMLSDIQGNIDRMNSEIHSTVRDILSEDDHTSNYNPLGHPSKEQWAEFDAAETERVNAVDSYHEAVKNGDFDEADRQADIARKAVYKKESVYNPGYVTDLDAKALKRD